MKFVYPEIDYVCTFQEGFVPTLVIEHKPLLLRFSQDIHRQLNGEDGKAVFSIGNTPKDISKYVEWIDNVYAFSLNQKSLISKISAALEKTALSAEHYQASQAMLSSVEAFLETISFDFPCSIYPTKLSIPALIKCAGIELAEDYTGKSAIPEKMIDYMELVREFDKDKLFIISHMRQYFEDDVMRLFMQTVLSHGLHVLMLESVAYQKLPEERRLTVDSDFCIF